MTDKITIRPATGTWVVRVAGAVIGESSQALELSEAGHEPMIYFPRRDLSMVFLEPSDTSTHCPHKGDARYFSVEAKSGTWKDVAWSYEDPMAEVAAIKDHIAFYTDKVAVEQL